MWFVRVRRPFRSWRSFRGGFGMFAPRPGTRAYIHVTVKVERNHMRLRGAHSVQTSKSRGAKPRGGVG